MASQGARFGEERREELHRLKLKIFHVRKLLFAVIHFQVAREISATYPSLEHQVLFFSFLKALFFARCLASANWACLAGHLVNGRRVQESTDVCGTSLHHKSARVISIQSDLNPRPDVTTGILGDMFLVDESATQCLDVGGAFRLGPRLTRRAYLHGEAWSWEEDLLQVCTTFVYLKLPFGRSPRVKCNWFGPDCYRFWQATKSERSPFPVLWCFLIEETLHHLR